MYPHMHRLRKMQIQIYYGMQLRPDTCKPYFTPSRTAFIKIYIHTYIYVCVCMETHFTCYYLGWFFVVAATVVCVRNISLSSYFRLFLMMRLGVGFLVPVSPVLNQQRWSCHSALQCTPYPRPTYFFPPKSTAEALREIFKFKGNYYI